MEFSQDQIVALFRVIYPTAVAINEAITAEDFDLAHSLNESVRLIIQLIRRVPGMESDRVIQIEGMENATARTSRIIITRRTLKEARKGEGAEE